MENFGTDVCRCLVDQQVCPWADGLFLRDLEPRLKQAIRHDFPQAKNQDFICSHHLLKYRLNTMNRMITQSQRLNRKANQKLTRIMNREEYEIEDVGQKLDNSLTFGEKIADGVAKFGGSWPFILCFISIMVVWIVINSLKITTFDPFPFILLNLFLSMISAIQAPLIMMSQNRAAEYDRLEAKNDYNVTLKSEEEIRSLHSKLDRIIQNEHPNLLEIQKIETQMLGEIQEQLLILRELQQDNLQQQKEGTSHVNR